MFRLDRHMNVRQMGGDSAAIGAAVPSAALAALVSF
jgi:hypothetical protein